MISIENARPYSDMDVDKLSVVKEVLELAPKGVFIEIGVRKGGTALMSLNANGCEYLIAIDPYLPFNDMQGNPIEMNEKWYEEADALLGDEAIKLDKRFTFMKMTSFEAMGRMWQLPKFAYVLLDGSHINETVQREIDFFSKRMEKGGIILVDNIDWLTLDFDGWTKPRYDMAYKKF